MSDALAANLPDNCAAAVRARKLIDSLEKAKVAAPEQTTKRKVRQKRAPRQAKAEATQVKGMIIFMT